MKIMLLALCFLLSTSTMTLFPEAVKASGNVLRDLKGDELVIGQSYYIVSALRPLGGGLGLDKVTNKTCPLDVTLLRNPLNNGIPISFSSFNDEDRVITDYSSVFISFDTKSSCAESTLWRVEEHESRFYLTIGGPKGDINTSFRLINEGGILSSNYKLVAFFVHNGRPGFSNVGIDSSLLGPIRLALIDQPFLVSFIKVEDYLNVLSVE